uniref:Uncharacterized protein n=1 Tax=Timema shepardi TaxID=629360 RepID=A0A7R9B5A0_TIMSH|nr:unnamed protein product [Timema shepardi]
MVEYETSALDPAATVAGMQCLENGVPADEILSFEDITEEMKGHIKECEEEKNVKKVRKTEINGLRIHSADHMTVSIFKKKLSLLTVAARFHNMEAVALVAQSVAQGAPWEAVINEMICISGITDYSANVRFDNNEKVDDQSLDGCSEMDDQGHVIEGTLKEQVDKITDPKKKELIEKIIEDCKDKGRDIEDACAAANKVMGCSMMSYMAHKDE